MKKRFALGLDRSPSCMQVVANDRLYQRSPIARGVIDDLINSDVQVVVRLKWQIWYKGTRYDGMTHTDDSPAFVTTEADPGCPGKRRLKKKLIYIDIDPDMAGWGLDYVLVHELTHAWDFSTNPTRAHAATQLLRGSTGKVIPYDFAPSEVLPRAYEHQVKMDYGYGY